ncbi:MAG: lipase family protein [Melioribacter sp.]|nr:lipase family protein [Melioribacter sp.]
MKKISNLLLLILILIFNLSCESDYPIEPELSLRGNLISINSINSEKASHLKSLLNNFNIDAELFNKFLFDVDVYKITYTTKNYDGRLIEATGALFVPKKINNLPLLSIQHGTQTKKNNVASQNPYYAIEGFIGALLGYYTLVPDYIGLGDSKEIHPYHHANSSANAVIDLIRAARKAAENLTVKLNGEVFLIGYSEGGFVTLAAQREIEKNNIKEITITASAPMAGAYDLYLTAQIILKNKFYNQPSFLAYLIYAYNKIYGWNKINEIFNSPYAEKISYLFEGTKTSSEINLELTNDLTKLFKDEFLTKFQNGSEKEFTNALKENSLINFVPISPTKLYHGDADEYVPYENSLKAKDYFNSRGANVQLVTIKNGTHLSAALPCIIDAILWFEKMRIRNKIAAKTQ